MKNFINDAEYQNKSPEIHIFLDSLKTSANEYGVVLDNIYELFNNNDFYNLLTEEEKEYVSEVFTILERYNLFLIEKKEFNIYKNFFENITLKKINYSTFFSDLKKNNLFNLEELCFELILDQNGYLIQKFITYLENDNVLFKNDEETTIKILNLNIDDSIKKKYIEFNETKIKNINKIISKKIRDFYIRKEYSKIKQIFFK